MRRDANLHEIGEGGLWSLNWRAVNGSNQLLLLLAGDRFVDGKL